MSTPQTAVEFAIEKLIALIPPGNDFEIGLILEKAKELERQQIVNAYNSGEFHCSDDANTYYNNLTGNKLVI